MIDVLSLVTNDAAPFYRQQVAALEACGVDCDTVAVPDPPEGNRSLSHYGRFYADTLASVAGEYDVVHANYGLTAPAALAQPRRPVVLSLWGSDLYGTYGPLSRWCARRCDEVIVMTDAMARELDADCHVVPHGVDLDRFAPRSRTEARSAVGWDEDATHVLFPYDPDRPVKNYPRARRVAEAAADRVDGRVELHAVHGVAHDRMPDYLNAADVVLLTSRTEGSPNAVKEALACDTPVVATAVGDVPERVRGLTYSSVCADDAALVDALADVLAAAPVSEGREQVRSLGLDRMAERIRSVYEAAGAAPEVIARA